MQYEKFTHEYWLSEAIKEAGTVNNEIPVCAILVKDNNIISKAVNRTEELKDSTAHAEILAIREASRIFSDWRLNGCTLYSTLEPCSMCMGAILNSRVSKLVFGAYDLDAGACGSALNLSFDLKKENHIEITGGIFELEASNLIKQFFISKR